MENRAYIIIFFFILLACVFLPARAIAYERTAHAALTGAVVDLYNRSFPEHSINGRLTEALIDGSQREDDNPRWLYHFYDPVNNRGLTVASSSWISAKQWAQDEQAQAGLSPSFQIASLMPFTREPITFTWQKAIRLYRAGDKENAFIALGHVLHLLEDAAVPEHVRNDPHPFGSPYERFASGRTPIIESEAASVTLNNLNDYFDRLARYSNEHFYSVGTIGGSGYSQPRPQYTAREGKHRYQFAVDEEGNGYRLAVSFDARHYPWALAVSQSLMDGDGNRVLTDYWTRLSRQAVRHGAGLLALFFQEASAGAASNAAGAVSKATNAVPPIPPTAKNRQTGLLAETMGAFKSLMAPAAADHFQEVAVIDMSGKPPPAPVSPKNVSAAAMPAPAPPAGGARTLSQNITPTPPAAECVWETSGQPVLRPVIINEINWVGAAGDSADEWLELKNVSETAADINGWQIVSESGNVKLRFKENSSVGPGRFLLLERGKEYRGALRNENDGLRLFNAACGLMDEALAHPSWPAGNNQEKRSAERSADLSWHDGAPHSPGAENSPAVVSSGGSEGSGGAGGQLLSEQPIQPETPASPPSQSSSTAPNSGAARPVLISEILFDADGSDDSKEFIELYNPGNSPADLSSWTIQHQSASGSLSKKNFEKGNSIAPKSFFLIWLGNDNRADLPWLSGSLNNSAATISIVNGSSTVDSLEYSSGAFVLFKPGQTLERRADRDSRCLSAGGEGEFFGNGCDTDTISDWEIRQTPNPQNSRNLPEPRAAPAAASGFTVSFSSSTMELVFSWEQNSSTPGRAVIAGDLPASLETVSGTARLAITEIGRPYAFSLQSFDRDGLAAAASDAAAATTAATVTPESFFRELFFYPDPNAPSSSDAIIEFAVDGYPFIPNIFHPREHLWTAVVFYLNRDPEPVRDLDDQLRFFNLKNSLPVAYDTCAYGSLLGARPLLFLPGSDRQCGVDGGAYNMGFTFNHIEDNRFYLIASPPAERPSFAPGDYLTAAFYATAGGNPSDGRYPYLRLVATDWRRYYFQTETPPHRPPAMNGLWSAHFDDQNSRLTVEWPPASDPDSLDGQLLYEIRYRPDEPWQALGRSLRHWRTATSADRLLIAVRARDEFGNYSTAAETRWPAEEAAAGE